MAYPMEIELVPESLNLVICDTPPSLPNAIRRTMMLNVESWAVESVAIKRYSGEDSIQHAKHVLEKLVFGVRRGMQEPSESQILTLRAMADDSKNILVVRSADITHDVLFVADPDIVITCLRYGKCIEVELLVSKKSGLFHEKWSPAVAVATHLEPIIRLDKTRVKGTNAKGPSLVAKSLITSCPTKVFEWSHDIEDLIIHTDRCILCRQCENDFEQSMSVEVTLNQNKCVLHVETNGTMSPAELVHQSADILKSTCKSLQFDL